MVCDDEDDGKFDLTHHDYDDDKTAMSYSHNPAVVLKKDKCFLNIYDRIINLEQFVNIQYVPITIDDNYYYRIQQTNKQTTAKQLNTQDTVCVDSLQHIKVSKDIIRSVVCRMVCIKKKVTPRYYAYMYILRSRIIIDIHSSTSSGRFFHSALPAS